MSRSMCWGFALLIGLTFALILLGASVRAMNAGLACPDWPLCFGQLIPDFHVEVYFEFLHRALAGIVAILSFVLGWSLLKSQAVRISVKILVGLSLAILVVQVIMGGLTVLKLLHEGIVTAHLALGTGFFALLLWIYFSISPLQPAGSAKALPSSLAALSFLVLLFIYGQILLGGLVASHYAGLVCYDFPLCNGQWIPTLKGIVGIQVLHRLGAYVVFATVFLLYLTMQYFWRQGRCSLEMKSLSSKLLWLTVIQMGVGVANIKFFTPPLLTVFHLALATVLLSLATRLVYVVVFLGFQARPANAKVTSQTSVAYP